MATALRGGVLLVAVWVIAWAAALTSALPVQPEAEERWFFDATTTSTTPGPTQLEFNQFESDLGFIAQSTFNNKFKGYDRPARASPLAHIIVDIIDIKYQLARAILAKIFGSSSTSAEASSM